MRNFGDYILLSGVLGNLPNTNPYLSSFKNIVLQPKATITEHDCGTKLGSVQKISTDLEGKTELVNDTVITQTRIIELMTAGVKEISIRTLDTCVSEYKKIINNDFEEEVKYWNVNTSNGASASRDIFFKDTGNMSAKYVMPTPLSAGVFQGLNQTLLYVKHAKRITARVASTVVGGIARLRLVAHSSNGTVLSTNYADKTINVASAWTDIQLLVPVYATNQVSYLTLYVEFNNTVSGAATFNVDSVQLDESVERRHGICQKCYTATTGLAAPSIGNTVTVPMVSHMPMYSFLASTYSGSLIGVKPIAKLNLPIRKELIDVQLNETMILRAMRELRTFKLIPQNFIKYCEDIPDKLEQALFILMLYGIYGSAS